MAQLSGHHTYASQRRRYAFEVFVLAYACENRHTYADLRIFQLAYVPVKGVRMSRCAIYTFSCIMKSNDYDYDTKILSNDINNGKGGCSD